MKLDEMHALCKEPGIMLLNRIAPIIILLSKYCRYYRCLVFLSSQILCPIKEEGAGLGFAAWSDGFVVQAQSNKLAFYYSLSYC